MPAVQQQSIHLNGIDMEYAEIGTGPVVLFCHGFPECWYSWRHQMEAVAAAGFRAIAPNQRGYGRTTAPAPVDAYNLCYLAGDMVALARQLDAGPVAIVGHDWGAPVAWTSALLRPDLFAAVVLMSVPYLARLWGGAKPTEGMRRMCGDDKMFYQLYFQQPGIAEAELEADPRDFLRRILVAASGDRPKPPAAGFGLLFDRSLRWIDTLPPVESLPPWITEEDVDVFVDHFRTSGFRGPLNWYRNLDANAELLAFLAGRKIEQPSLFIAGERDAVIRMYPKDLESLEATMPALRGKVLIPGAGHWIQQERASEVNRLLVAFLTGSTTAAS
jgi:pimeloyl-ACP methyl ester carboxylesterase